MSVGALITWPYKAGDRSRRGSPKAGTTVQGEWVRHVLRQLMLRSADIPFIVEGGGRCSSYSAVW